MEILTAHLSVNLMICIKCNNDLAKCICDNLEERLNEVKKMTNVFLGPEYEAKIRAHIHQRKKISPSKGNLDGGKQTKTKT